MDVVKDNIRVDKLNNTHTHTPTKLQWQNVSVVTKSETKLVPKRRRMESKKDNQKLSFMKGKEIFRKRTNISLVLYTNVYVCVSMCVYAATARRRKHT